MKRLYIHAGTYKTGTSHFQHVMYHNRDRMKKAGLLYPERGLGLNTPHHKYAHRVAAIQLAQHGKNAFPDIVKQLVDDDALDTALISYEGFTNPNTVRHLAKIKECFEPVELHVILVFRPHIDYLISLYREACQHVTFKGLLTDFLDKNSNWALTFNYSNIIKIWEDLVGREQVHLLSYNEAKKDLFGAILKPTNYTPMLEIPEGAKANPTISAPACAVARKLNHFKLPGKLRHEAGYALARLDRKNPHFHDYCEITEPQARELEATMAEDRQKLTSYGLKESDFLMGDKWRWGTKELDNRVIDEAFAKFICLLKDENHNQILEAIKA